MIILGIESATARAGVAIGTPDGVVASTQVTRGPRHAETLVPSIQFVCEQAGIGLDQVDAIAVDIGPGLFTGLRVGIATANGLAQALDVPMIGVCSLDVLAHPFRHAAADIVSVIDARRAEVYAARYGVADGELTRMVEPSVLPPAELLAGVGDALVVGDTLGVFALPSAETLVELAVTRELVNPSAIAPLYLRKSDAELNAERGGVMAAELQSGPLDVHLTPMRRRHLRTVLRIETEVYPRPWTINLFVSELGMRASRSYYVAKVGPTVVGYSGLMLVGEDAHVTTIAVDPAWQQHQIGRRLMLNIAVDAVKRGARHLTLEVRVSNEPAQKLYRTFGFRPAGIRKGYYVETNEDALVMWADDIDHTEYLDRLLRIETDIQGATTIDRLRP